MISIITPTYNEAKNLPELARRIDNALKEYTYEFIIVDDNSPDGTGEVAERLSNQYPIRVLHREGKLGLSSAVTDGFAIAKGEVFGVIDADLSHPPEKIPELLKAMEESDFVIGSRLIKGGKVEEWPFHRKLISWSARQLARPLTPVKDIMSGFFFIKKEVVNDIKLKPRGYKICLEILIKGKYNKVKEVPFVFMNRSVGESKLNMKTNLEYVLQLVDLYQYKILQIFGLK